MWITGTVGRREAAVTVLCFKGNTVAMARDDLDTFLPTTASKLCGVLPLELINSLFRPSVGSKCFSSVVSNLRDVHCQSMTMPDPL